jgi:hypothetical protein
MNLGRRSRDQDVVARNVRPRNETVTTRNGYAFNVHVYFKRNGDPWYVKVTPIWRPEDDTDLIIYSSTLARVLKSQAAQVAR